MVKKRDNFIRAIKGTIEVSPVPARELFIKKAKNDSRTGVPFSSLDNYLSFFKTTIEDMQKKKIIRQNQIDTHIFPSRGNVDVNKWDTSLVLSMLQNVTPILKTEQIFIDEIREVRNRLIHEYSTTAEIDDDEFRVLWKKIEYSIIGLARNINGAYLANMKNRIEKLRYESLPQNGPVIDLLRQWYADQEGLKEKWHRIETSLEDVIVASKTTSGTDCKKMKTADTGLENLKDRFKQTLKQKLPTDFKPLTEELEAIKSKLAGYHRVVVTGYDNPELLETSLAAILQMSYNVEHCIQIDNVNDWIHVNRQDVALAIFVYPFGTESYNKDATKAMYNNFGRFMNITTTDDEEGKIDIIFVTQPGVLKHVCKDFDHEFLKHVAQINRNTEPSNPACTDVEEVKKNAFGPVMKHLKDQSTNYIQVNQPFLHKTSDNYYKQAFGIFNTHGMIVIAGPTQTGKTLLAIHLMSRYDRDKCLVLMDPCDWKFVDLDTVDVLLIENFVGKYQNDLTRASNWFANFDMIYAFVRAGMLKLIITCDDVSLRKCTEMIYEHDLLSHKIVLSATEVISPTKIEPCPTTASSSNLATLPDDDCDVKNGIKIVDTGYVAEKYEETTRPINLSNKAILPDGVCDVKNGNKIVDTEYVAEKYEETTPPVNLPDKEIDALWSQNTCVETVQNLINRKSLPLIRKFLVSSNYERKNDITAMCLLPDDSLLLYDDACWSLKRFENSATVNLLDSLHNINCWALCCIDSRTVAIKRMNEIVLVDVSNTMYVKTRIYIKNNDHKTIAYGSGKIFTCGGNMVYVYKTENFQKIEMYENADSTINYNTIAINPKSLRIYLTDFQRGLIMLDKKGKTCKGPIYEEEHGAVGSCMINDKAVLFCCDGSHNVVMCDKMGRKRQIVIEFGINPKTPRCICYDSKHSRLLIAFKNEESYEAFDTSELLA